MIKYYCCLIKFEKHLVRMIYVFFEIQPVWKLQYVNKYFCTKKVLERLLNIKVQQEKMQNDKEMTRGIVSLFFPGKGPLLSEKGPKMTFHVMYNCRNSCIRKLKKVYNIFLESRNLGKFEVPWFPKLYISY